MNFRNHFYILSLIAITAMYSCETLKEDGRISEGIIEYEVTYPKLDPSSILIELLPTKMTMSFKDDKFTTDLAAGFGMFRMTVIADGDDMEVSQMVKLINDRFVVNYDEESIIASNDQFPKIEIKHTGKTEEIAGFMCKEAIISVLTDSAETFTVYYTDEIRLTNPNWFTQFTEIEGVLLEYQVERYNLCSRFKASKITPKEINDDTFIVPDEYTEIIEQEMNDKMQEIFNNFSE